MSLAGKLKRRLTELDRITTAYDNEAAPVLAAAFRPDCCINGTWVALHVFHRFGLQARPMSVRAIACNSSYLKALKTEFKEHEPDAWAVLFDVESISDMPGWNGHLVALVEGKVLVDSAAGNAARPLRGIHVPQLVVAPWRANKECHLALPEGGLLAYDERKTDKSYLDMPGFQGHEGNLTVASTIYERMRAWLDAT